MISLRPSLWKGEPESSWEATLSRVGSYLTDWQGWLQQAALNATGILAGRIGVSAVRSFGTFKGRGLGLVQLLADESGTSLLTSLWRVEDGKQAWLYEAEEGVAARGILLGIYSLLQRLPVGGRLVQSRILQGIVLTLAGLVAEQLASLTGSKRAITSWSVEGWANRMIDTQVLMLRGRAIRRVHEGLPFTPFVLGALGTGGGPKISWPKRIDPELARFLHDKVGRSLSFDIFCRRYIDSAEHREGLFTFFGDHHLQAVTNLLWNDDPGTYREIQDLLRRNPALDHAAWAYAFSQIPEWRDAPFRVVQGVKDLLKEEGELPGNPVDREGRRLVLNHQQLWLMIRSEPWIRRMRPIIGVPDPGQELAGQCALVIINEMTLERRAYSSVTHYIQQGLAPSYLEMCHHIRQELEGLVARSRDDPEIQRVAWALEKALLQQLRAVPLGEEPGEELFRSIMDCADRRAVPLLLWRVLGEEGTRLRLRQLGRDYGMRYIEHQFEQHRRSQTIRPPPNPHGRCFAEFQVVCRIMADIVNAREFRLRAGEWSAAKRTRVETLDLWLRHATEQLRAVYNKALDLQPAEKWREVCATQLSPGDRALFAEGIRPLEEMIHQLLAFRNRPEVGTDDQDLLLGAVHRLRRTRHYVHDLTGLWPYVN